MKRPKDEIPADILAMTDAQIEAAWNADQNPTPEQKAELDALIARRDKAQADVEAYSKRKFLIQARYLKILEERVK